LYPSHLPKNHVAFHLQLLDKIDTTTKSVWCRYQKVGINSLKTFIPKLCDEAGIDVLYTNHSLRATSVSRMFQGGVPEKVVIDKSGVLLEYKHMKKSTELGRTEGHQFRN
jgi:N-formylglutamate amidohydrolase